jgi:hypothetical protein
MIHEYTIVITRSSQTADEKPSNLTIKTYAINDVQAKLKGKHWAKKIGGTIWKITKCDAPTLPRMDKTKDGVSVHSNPVIMDCPTTKKKETTVPELERTKEIDRMLRQLYAH